MVPVYWVVNPDIAVVGNGVKSPHDMHVDSHIDKLVILTQKQNS